MSVVAFVFDFPDAEDQVCFLGASVFALDLRWVSDFTPASPL